MIKLGYDLFTTFFPPLFLLATFKKVPRSPNGFLSPFSLARDLLYPLFPHPGLHRLRQDTQADLGM